MAYNKEVLFKKAKEEITKNNLFFIEDVSAFIGINKSTFYRHFPTDSDEYNDLKELLQLNVIKTKTAIRGKLFKNGKASDILALYRMIATDKERKAISLQHIEVEDKTETPRQYIIVSPKEDEQ